MEKTKVKELYQLLIRDEEIADFKKKMVELQKELGYRIKGTREKETQEINKIMAEKEKKEQLRQERRLQMLGRRA